MQRAAVHCRRKIIKCAIQGVPPLAFRFIENFGVKCIRSTPKYFYNARSLMRKALFAVIFKITSKTLLTNTNYSDIISI